MARAKAAKGGQGHDRQARGGAFGWLGGMICGAVLAFAAPVALLAGVLLAPALVAAVLDTTQGRPVARTVALAGTSLTLGPVWRLLLTDRSLASALEILADPVVPLLAWLAGACGWAACELLPVVLRAAADMRAAAQLAGLQAEAAALREGWDLE